MAVTSHTAKTNKGTRCICAFSPGFVENLQNDAIVRCPTPEITNRHMSGHLANAISFLLFPVFFLSAYYRRFELFNGGEIVPS
jgi:hypothetical protein